VLNGVEMATATAAVEVAVAKVVVVADVANVS
jgi:hypothetical protein